jgi:CBS domain-containing protein
MLLKQKVKDRMIPLENYPTISPEVTLRDAALSLRTSFCELDRGMCTEAGPRTVSVVDEAGKLVGILDFKSFLETMIPEIAGGLSARLSAMGVSIAFAQADAETLDESRLGFRARVIKNAEAKVRNIMLKVRGSIDADARLIDGMKQMFRNKIIVLPVYEGGKLVGVLRDTDLFLAVADVLED